MMVLRNRLTLPGVQVHYAAERRWVGSRRYTIVDGDDSGQRQKLGRVPVRPAQRALALNPLWLRLVRGGVHLILPAGDQEDAGWLVVAERMIFWLRDGRMRPIFKIARGRRPLRRGLCVVGENLFIGEYWSNPERTAVHLHKIHLSTGKTDLFYQFDAQTIRHIHTVDKDPYSRNLWLSTGDEDPECQIRILNADTGQAETIGQGSQKWRTVSFAFRPDAVYWGTDNHLGHNQIWRYDRATGQTTPIGDVIGPVYYNVCLKDYILFGTTMEKGEGDQDGYGRLYALDAQNCVAEVWRRRKDRWHPRWFGYGVFEFAEGRRHNNQFWVTEKGFESRLRSLLCELSDE